MKKQKLFRGMAAALTLCLAVQAAGMTAGAAAPSVPTEPTAAQETVNAVQSGVCGSGVAWTLDESSGVLRIRGKGKMDDFPMGGAPWSEQAWQITRVVVEKGVTALGECAFYGLTVAEEISLPEGLTEIGAHALMGCDSLTEMVIPQGVVRLGDYAAAACNSLTALRLPDTLKEIGFCAFGGNERLESAALPDSALTLGGSIFARCFGLRQVRLPAGLTVLPDGFFSNCYALEEVTLPEGLTEIGSYAFRQCGSLAVLDIPRGVTAVGTSALSGMGETEIYFHGAAPAFGQDAFTGSAAKLYYPAEDASWTAAVREGCGGSVTWIAVGADGTQVEEPPAAPGMTTVPLTREPGGGWRQKVRALLQRLLTRRR